MNNAKFNKIFQLVNESKHRYKIMYGSAGSGKSVNIAQDYIIKLSSPEYAGCSLLVVRGVEVSHLNSTFAELTGAVDRLGLGSVWKTKLNPLTLQNTMNGNTIIFRGANDQRAIERLKSVSVPTGKITWVWIEEATELKHSDVEAINDRLRGVLPEGHYFQITMSFNPVSAAHFIKTKYVDFADSNPDIFVHKSTYLDNKFIDAEYHRRMELRKQIDPDGYKIYGLGEWGEVGGLIFDNVSFGDYKDKHFDNYSIGCDWGFAHATAVLLIGWDNENNPYVLNEIYSIGQTTEEIIRQCEAAGIPKDVIMWCDSAEPDRIKQAKSGDYKAYPVKKEKNVTSNQITWLKGRKIFVDGRCANTQREIQQYKWAKNPTTGDYEDTPVNFGDDTIKALMYGCESVRKQTKIKSMKKSDIGLW
jgi:phage terminase large subunit